MDLEFTDEQQALRDNARSVLSSACPPSLVRSVFDGAEDAPELWSTLVDLDWPALSVPTEHGGLGLGFVEVGIVVEELARVVAPTPYLATVTQLLPVLREAGASALLAGIASGTCTGTLALAEDGRWSPDAVRTTARRVDRGWVLDGVKSHVLDGARAMHIAVVARGAVEAAPVVVIDPTLPIATITLRDVRLADDLVVTEPGDPRADAVIARAVEEATTAMALSTVATCRAIFEATLQYAKDREQFGKPIGSFQALKHRLADCYLAVERASSLGWFAALTIAEDDDRRHVATAMAKAAAGDCQRLLTHDGLQLHGGIGFTWEHDLHFFLKRAKAGDLLFGTAATHRAHLAELLGLERTA
jgi:alkylation response protein AidB-like acyl-CoA dehydrogenase